MKVATYNGCKVYNLSNSKSLPLFLSSNKKRQLSQNSEYSQRVELIQDFNAPTSIQCLKLTNDYEHILLTGTYAPVLKCYTTSEMSLKFQRGLISDVVAMESLSDNYGKLILLHTDRTLNIHAPYGQHYSLRIPKFGRDISYNWNTCDVFIGGACDEIFRLNLELGVFKESLSLGFSGCNKLSLNPCHPLLACGGESSQCEFWDLRNRNPVSKMSLKDSNIEITSLKFDTDGLTLGVGTSNGNCLLYDIRSSRPLYTKEHQYGVPIIDINFHNDSGNIISTDKKIMKVWKRSGGQMGQIVTNIEPSCDINTVLPIRDQRGSTGLFFLAGEQSNVMSYYIPALGPAPKWCSFLEGITEELEEKSIDTINGTVYEDYKFITKTEVDELGANGLIGTPMLRGYMHGFFIEMSLYNKLRAVSKPFEYEEHKKEKIRQKLEEKRQSRINVQKRLPKYNQQLAEKFMKNVNVSNEDEREKKESQLVDDRFSALFNREEFQQDLTSLDYKLRNPTQSSRHSKRHSDENYDSEENEREGEGELEDIFDKIEDEDEDEDEGEGRNGNYNDEDEDEDDDDSVRSDDSIGINQIKYQQMNEHNIRSKPKSKSSSSLSHSRGEDKSNAIINKTQKILQKRSQQVLKKGESSSTSSSSPRMYELSQGITPDRALFSHTKEEQHQRQLNKIKNSKLLSQRLNNLNNNSSDQSKNHEMNEKKNNKSNIKILKTPEGIVRELSYLPSREHSREDKLDSTQSKSKSKSENQSRSQGKGKSLGHRTGGGRGGEEEYHEERNQGHREKKRKTK